ncbi:MAG: PAS domain S-box protein [Holophagaceae bacterium]
MDPLPLALLASGLAAGAGLGGWWAGRRGRPAAGEPALDLAALAGLVSARLDAGGRIREPDAALAAFLGTEPGALAGRPLLDLLDAADREACAEPCGRLLRGETARGSLEARLAGGDPPRWVHLDGWPLPEGGVRCLLRETTEVHRAQEALQESEARWRTIAETASCAIFIYTRTFTYVSGYACELLGRSREELLDTPFWEVVHPDDRETVRARGLARQRGEPVPSRYEFRVLRPDGTVRWVDFTAGAIQHGGQTLGLGTAFDITDRVAAVESRLEMERRMLESQRLESLGLMAGGVAHDFNNLLTIILGNASLALEEAAPGGVVHGALGAIASTAHRAADLTRQMLAYSGRGRFLREPTDLNATLRALTTLVESSIPRHIRLHYDLAPDLPAVEADPTQLQQVVLNLLTNAVEALGERAGSITVRTSLQAVAYDDLAAALHDQRVEAGPHLLLEVADTGAGMDEETRRRIFDPFFTTKPSGRGLGLAALQGIVRAHRGGITVESAPGLGTTFRVYLPALGMPAHAASEPPAADPAWTSTGRILVVDDEASIREMATRVLRRAGFEVATAAHGQEGVEALARQPGDVRAVLLDLSMPVMGGGEALAALRALSPGLPVLLSSGYEGESRVQQLLQEPATRFLQKPYTAPELLSAMRELLGE